MLEKRREIKESVETVCTTYAQGKPKIEWLMNGTLLHDKTYQLKINIENIEKKLSNKTEVKISFRKISAKKTYSSFKCFKFTARQRTLRCKTLSLTCRASFNNVSANASATLRLSSDLGKSFTKCCSFS